MFTYWYFMIVCNYTTDHLIKCIRSSRLFEFFDSYIFIRVSYVVRSRDEDISIQLFTMNTVVFISFISNLHSGIYNATIRENITKLKIFNGYSGTI